MPTPQYTAMHPHSTTTSSNTNDNNDSSSQDLAARSPKTKTDAIATTSRPFTLGRRSSTTTNKNNNGRPIYGRRSKSYDPRLNSRVTNEHRVPLDVRVNNHQSNSRGGQQEENFNLRRTSKTVQKSRGRRSEGAAAGMSTWSTKDGERDSNDNHRAKNNGDITALEVCKESMSPDVADYQKKVSLQKKDVRRDDNEVVVGSRSKSSSKRRLSFPDEKGEDETDNDHDLMPAKKLTSENKERNKVKRRRMKSNTLNDDENIRPHDAHNNNNNNSKNEEEENLSFTETTEQQEKEQPIPQTKSTSHHHRRSSMGTKATTTITIQTKSKKGGNIVLPHSTKSYIRELRDLAKVNCGTATLYKATYHTGSKPIIDKNSAAVTGSGSNGGGNCSSNMIQVGQLIIKETFVTLKGKKGGNSYLFEGWKLPGSKQRDSSIYDSTRPKLLVGGDDSSVVVVLTTRAPRLIVDTALSVVDAARVRKFVMEAESGQTPVEFFACEDDDRNGEVDGESGEGKETLLGGSVVSGEENERNVDDGRKVLGDRSNTAGRALLKGKVQKSPNMKLSNRYHKARTRSARKKRKSAHNISPTEPRKKRMMDSIVRFYVPDSKDDCPKCFGLIEGIGGGLEEKGLSNVTPHRGRLLELPGAVLSGQWETRLVKDKSGGNGSDESLRISLRHEHSSLRSLEYLLTGKDDTPDGHFVSIIKPAIDRTHSLIHQGVVLEEEIEVDDAGRERISNNAFIGCVSLVLFDGFLSSSEAVGESRDVASRFLKNCVPSNELQSGRDLYGIVGNEHNSNDDENITGMLFPCNASFGSEHVVLLLHNEESQVCGIDVIFRPPKKWLRHFPLTEALLEDHMDDTGSDDGEIMKRYIEKNIPSPMRHKPASIDSNHDTGQSEEEVEQRTLDETGFDNNGEPDFDVNNDDKSSVRDPQHHEKVHRLEEESRTLKQRIELLEEEKRLLKQQIVDKPSVETASIAKLDQARAVGEIADDPNQIEPVATYLAATSVETANIANLDQSRAVDEITVDPGQADPLATYLTATLAETTNIAKSDQSRAVDEITVDPGQAEPVATNLTATLAKTTNIAKLDQFGAVNEIADDSGQIEPLSNTHTVGTKPKKIAFGDLFWYDDSLSGELINKQAQVEPAAFKAKTTAAKKVAVKDLFGDNDSLFGVSTKKQINISRRKSTGGLKNHRTLLQKQNRGRHSTGGLPGAKSITNARNQVELIPASKASSQSASSTKRFAPARQTTAEKGRTVATQATHDSTLSERPKTKKSIRRSTFPIELRGKLRFSTGTHTSVSKKSTKKSNVRVSRKKVKAADFFEDKIKKSNRRSTFPTESRGKLRLSSGTTSVSKKSNAKVADFFEDDCGPTFGFAAKALSEKKRAKSTSIEANLIPNDMHSVSSLGGGSFSFESLSTQSLGKAHTNAVADDRSVNGTQPLFDVYFGMEASNGGGCSEGSVSTLQQVENQPFFDYYFGGQDLSELDDESTQYSIQPFHSIYYGFDDHSTLHSTEDGHNEGTVPTLQQNESQPLFFDYYFGGQYLSELDDESTQYSIQPFHSVYFGRGSDDQSALHSITSSFEITECVPAARPPFFDHYFGLEEESSMVCSPSIMSQQTPSATEHSFNGQGCKVAAKLSWRFDLATCFRFLVVAVFPALLPMALLFSKHYSPDFSDQFDAHGLDEIVVEEMTNSWWSLKPWE